MASAPHVGPSTPPEPAPAAAAAATSPVKDKLKQALSTPPRGGKGQTPQTAGKGDHKRKIVVGDDSGSDPEAQEAADAAEASDLERALLDQGAVPFEIGARVQAEWEGEWLDAKIIKHAPRLNSYTVKWDGDGTQTSGLSAQDGRLRMPAQPTPASQPGNEPGAGEPQLGAPPQQAA